MAVKEKKILLGHGSGGKLTHELIDRLFVKYFSNPALDRQTDAALLDLPGNDLAFTTDAFVVDPIFFPGGDIGDLAVNGTVNDSFTIEPPCDVLDWTGTLQVDRGIVLIRRVVLFERPFDSVVRPRPDRQTVAWNSHTGGHYDGLVVEIIEPPLAEVDSLVSPNMFHVDMPGFQGSFPVSELADMDELIEVDDLGNRLSINGFTLEDIDLCPKGFLSGRYRIMNRVAPDSVDTGDHGERLGAFAGAQYGLHGRIDGFMRGGYGLDSAGKRVFVGKFIDRQGRFGGLIGGTWEPAGNEGELASFRGEWVTRGGRVEGVLGGEAHPVEGYPGGFLVGRWTTSCDEEASAEVLK